MTIAEATKSSRPPTAVPSGTAPVLVDAHVHLYTAFDHTLFLEGALTNIRQRASEIGLAEDTSGWLLLTETSRDNAFAAFAAFAERADGAPAAGWSVHGTAEPGSLVIRRNGRKVLGLVAGRQIVTREGLEVLALATTATFSDGEGLDSTLEAVRAADALPVLPWGFGKWTSHRGALVEERIRGAKDRGLFFGDNGGRLALGARPRLLNLAEAYGFVVLPGSDPLPFTGQEARVASFGFVLDGPISADRPAESLKALLRDLPASPRAYGRSTGLVPFVRNQIFMQLRKHGISS